MKITAQADPRYLSANRFRSRKVEPLRNMQGPIDMKVSKPVGDLRCFNCGKPGHISKECRAPRRNVAGGFRNVETADSFKGKEPATRR